MGTNETPKVQVETTEVIPKGKVVLSWGGKTPTILARACKALRYFCVSLITLVGATDLFSGLQAKEVSFILGVFILFTGAVELFIGIEPIKS